jgi:predicted nucleic acid-binding protein
LKRLLVDVNVVLDLILDQPPFAETAGALWAAAERKEVEVLVPAHGVTTIFYVVARQRGAAFARRILTDLLAVLSVAPVDGAILRRALALGHPDFEDAVCAAAAEATDCDVLVTRDPKGYPDSPVLVVDPPTALSLLQRTSGPKGVAERPAPAYDNRRRVRARSRQRNRSTPRKPRSAQLSSALKGQRRRAPSTPS